MRTLLLSLIPLAACASLADTHNYAGPLRPLAGTCDPPSQALLTEHNAAIIFAPDSGILLLRGQIAGENLSATLALTDSNKQPYHLVFQGVLSGHDISGTYTTPRCRYGVTLHLTRD